MYTPPAPRNGDLDFRSRDPVVVGARERRKALSPRADLRASPHRCRPSPGSPTREKSPPEDGLPLPPPLAAPFPRATSPPRARPAVSLRPTAEQVSFSFQGTVTTNFHVRCVSVHALGVIIDSNYSMIIGASIACDGEHSGISVPQCPGNSTPPSPKTVD